ncbi:MAG TPA: hypothetical protein VNN76_00900 [Bacteroidota bacterium]|nr:hypothetical protein [Bacteroidota bacterium]
MHRKLHLIVGFLTCLVFLATGAYMRSGFPDLHAGNESIRFLYRANHVYILFSGLLNLCLGLYLTESSTKWRNKLQTFGSRILFLAPILFILAFFVEPPMASPTRPLTLVAAFLSVGGVLCHVIGGLRTASVISNRTVSSSEFKV